MRRLPPAKYLAESFLIVASILLAFLVEEYRVSRNEAETRRVAISNIHAEVEANLMAVERVLPYHRELAGALSAWDTTESDWRTEPAFETLAAVAPAGIQPPELQRTAWEAAKTSGAVALFPYVTNESIAKVYRGQEMGVEATVQRLVDRILTPEMFMSEDQEAMVRLVGMMAGELAAQEQQLVGSLRELLGVLEGGAQ